MKVNEKVIGAAIGMVAGGTAGYFVGKAVGSRSNAQELPDCVKDIQVSPNCAALAETDDDTDTDATEAE